MFDMTRLLLPPDRAVVQTDSDALHALHPDGGNAWASDDGVGVTARPDGDTLQVLLSAPANVAVQRVCLRWHLTSPAGARVLGDAWERGYGDLEWRGLVPERALPWYFLMEEPGGVHGAGVQTGASALCWWQVDSEGISLWLDVRCGGVGVQLGGRTLPAATVQVHAGMEGETAFQAAHALCRAMCPRPLLPTQPVYGGNNWYYAYGSSTHAQIVQDAQRIADHAPSGPNLPWMVVDAGWHPNSYSGPWRTGNHDFPDMPGLAAQMRERGTRPGLWIRPLLTTETALPDAWFLPERSEIGLARDGAGRVLDPSVPEVLEHIREDIRTLTGWGYALIKHDFSTFDLLGRWGMTMNSDVTASGWHFADRSQTTAEVLLGLYRALREAAGSALLLGCNTVGHLGAGLFEMQRTGDDTSGREWERTRKMGINTLAFRMAQHDTFFAVDADCVGLTTQVPWHLNRQWLDLLARSGTPLFVSAAPDALGAAQSAALREAFARAALPQSPAEPLDWMDTTCPARWRFGDTAAPVSYHWHEEAGE